MPIGGSHGKKPPNPQTVPKQHGKKPKMPKVSTKTHGVKPPAPPKRKGKSIFGSFFEGLGK